MTATRARLPAMKRIILESPYAGNIEHNTEYARAALHDSLMRGEAPIASHLLYTQDGVLDETIPNERQLGIDAGHAWMEAAEAVVFYIDLGMSKGMKAAQVRSLEMGKSCEHRYIWTARRQMRHNELILDRRWEVLAMAHEAKSMGELCSTLGASYGATRRALDALGIERRWPRGIAKGTSGQEKSERNAGIIALREQDLPLSFKEIGIRYEISRERVRQILNANERPDLCGAIGKRILRNRHDARLVEWACVNCGKSEKRLPSKTKSKTCSRKCFGENKQFPLEETQLILGPRILELREADRLWREITEVLGIKASAAHTILQRWAKRVGADISHLRTNRPGAKLCVDSQKHSA